MPSPILLLKTKSSPHDGYDDFFLEQGYDPTFIPVLEHRFHAENLAHVRGLFASGAFDTSNNTNANANTDTEPKKYGGLIFTSQRAVEGFAKMIEEDGLPIEYDTTTSLILYTVGPATARSLTTLRDQYLPTATIHGADTGTGENLAHMILAHYNAIYPLSSSSTKPSLLFLVGEQRRDIIPKTLMGPSSLADRISVDEIVVYETGEMGSFEGDFESAVQRYASEPVLWVVVFSPSGCEAMLRVLGLGPFADAIKDDSRRLFISTIGPTTRNYLQSKFAFEADVCAENPTPLGVGDGIRQFMDAQTNRR
ncbi:Tetrapyrrole biosynthesis uroporphyrinogen III synthase [Penicillium taxi]|uniref:Tetrapyrrole biosynthesis uroporphyrinogen III synthase n=1 Tax=Penicillium taxi TaxID=168475 RepID=UPI00254587BD|nr:Tetrapyrrole biosynthesis uroporphyrinogen III synthase [Penicillium taxi]KAJ5898783.1 Tetrapyrrole biosynthesis uroporphyrinogen III synthase [Penicillium taxi]